MPINTPSGVIIDDVQVGTGAECTSPKQTVKVHYRGTLTEAMGGKEFDSSYKRGQPIEFNLGQLIKGWQEGIPGMKVGGIRKLTIPWKMAYGEHGSPPVIPARADLIFQIELLGVR
jgi:FKBP-type peptidyl-prolyl cis-trans isomerase FkpA